MFGVIGLFVIPWYFPSSEPVWSLSYEYGFNNRLAWLFLVISLALLSLISILDARGSPRPDSAADALEEILQLDPIPLRNLRLRRAAFLTTAAVVLLSSLWYWILPYSIEPEMTYFVERLKLMVLGYQPYSDFDFHYGPLLIFPQYWLYRLANGWLSVELAYLLVFLLQVTVGLALTYFVFASLGGEADLTLCFILTIGFFVLCLPDLGLNYTFFRFGGPAAALIFFQARLAKKGKLARSAAGLALTTAVLLVSPEIGIATALAFGCYFLLRKDISASLTLLLSVPALVFLAGPDYLDGLRRVAGGAGNFPILPIAPIVFLFAALVLLIPLLVRCEWMAREDCRGFASAFLVLTLAMVPAALGRADPGHVFFNELGFYILGLVYAANQSHLLRRRLGIGAYALAFIAIPGLISYPGVIARIIDEPLRTRWGIIKQRGSYWTNPELVDIDHPRYLESKPLPRLWFEMVQGLSVYGPLGLPFGADPVVERYLRVTGQYVHAYQLLPLQIFTRSALERELVALGKIDRLLVPAQALDVGTEPLDEKAYNALQSRMLSELLRFPVSFRSLKKQPFIGRTFVAAYVRENFSVQNHWRHYLVLVRNRGHREEETRAVEPE